MSAKKVKELIEKTQFKQEKQIRYLGIYMVNKVSTLMEDNYLRRLQDMQKDLEKWDKLQLSLMDRITMIKMNVIRRVLFLFQTIPIILKQSFLQDLNKMVMNFIWQGKKPRIHLKAMQDLKYKAGFGLPDRGHIL